MKIAILAALLVSALSGCAIVPYGPRVYMQSPVVVEPAPVYYGAPGYYYGHGGGWGHGYRH